MIVEAIGSEPSADSYGVVVYGVAEPHDIGIGKIPSMHILLVIGIEALQEFSHAEETR